MQVELERREAGEVELKISVEPQAVAEEISKFFNQAARSVQVPGFRPGKAPRALIEQQIDQEVVRQEALDRLAQSSYLAALQQTGIKPIDRAKIEDEQLQEDGSFTFRAVVAVMPEVKLGEYRGLKVAQPQVQITDELVDRELEAARRRFLTYVSQSDHPLEKGDVAILDYVLEVAGQPADAPVNGYPLEVGADNFFPELNEGLLGATAGEVRRIESRLPHAQDPDSAGKTATLVVTVTDVKVSALPALDDEFAHKYAGAQNVEELRGRLREVLEQAATQHAEQTVRERLISLVVGASEAGLPRPLVEKFRDAREAEVIAELARQGVALEDYLAQRGATYADWRRMLEAEARRNLKRFLVLRELEREAGITASEEEIAAEVSRLAEQENVTAVAKRRQLERDDALEELVSQLKHEKAIALLLASAEVTPEEPAEAAPVQTEAPEHGKE